MKNLRNNKLSRVQLKGIAGSGIIIGNCSNECCPKDGRPRCPRLICPAVVCPEYM